MKRVVSIFLALMLCCALFVMPVSAAEASSAPAAVTVRRIDLPDGGYIIETVVTHPAMSRASQTTSGEKTAVRYAASGKAIYGVRVDGTFTYNGTTSSATGSAATVYIYDSDASYVSKSAWYSGNTAYASGTVKYLGLSESRTVSISCDKNGNLS